MAESREHGAQQDGQRGPSDPGSERSGGPDVQREGPPLELHSNPLTSFEVGAITDLRFRMACDLIKSELFAGMGNRHADTVAAMALDLAAALVQGGIDREWVLPLPEGEEIPSRVQRHLKMGVRAQVLTQRWSQEIAQSMDPGIMRPQMVTPRQ